MMDDDSKKWESFIQRCDAVLDDADEVRLISDSGADFADSVAERIQKMRGWAAAKHGVSERMEAALDRMHEGLKKWLDHAPWRYG